MKHVIQTFIDEVGRKGHLNPFLKGKGIQVQINTNGEEAYFFINNGSVCMGRFPHSFHVEISGESEVIQSLLMGEIRLRSPIGQKLIQVKGSFRAVLFLETLFFLSKPHQNAS